MQIPPNKHSTIEPKQTTTKPTVQSPIKASPVETTKSNLSVYQQTKKMQDLAVLTASRSNSIANNPMELLFKTAIEEINKQLEPILGKNAAQSAYESNLDVSPEATADRIIQGSTAFYQAFKEQNSELAEEASLNEFLNVINAGIEKGFAEAKEILDSLSVLEGDIENDIDLTFDFVQQGLIAFKEQILANLVE
tara:strand:+ start:34 stop:615 length:582 start_codon:yes stop_codon:yes gene_type:complete